jgi:phosphate starvation-inducible PhoH-like protein
MAEILFKPVNQSQRQAQRAFQTSDVLFLLGEAGSGKTHTALGLAATQALSTGSRIVLSRPTVASGGEEIGFLPGKVEQKMHPWLLPLHDVLRRLTFSKPEEFIKAHCEIAPLAFMRGRTFDRSIAILDEAQNASRDQLLMFLTRIGEKGKLIVTGDLSQTDRADSGLSSIITSLEANPVLGVSVIDLTSEANPRHSIIPRLLKALAGSTTSRES